VKKKTSKKKMLPAKEKLFGTDGIRGTPGVYPLTEGMIVKIARAIADFVVSAKKNGKTKIVIGKDTRTSGDQIENILAHTICVSGVDVYLAGTITTPGLSFMVKTLSCDMGIMISASHNKAADNGIKLFNSDGLKLSPKEEEYIEDDIFCNLGPSHCATVFVQPRPKGDIKKVKNTCEKYIQFLSSTLQGTDLKGVKIALDCAWGAASPFAKKLFRKLGAKVDSIHDTPSGENINEGGAVHPALLRELVLSSKSDIGVAVDGDGDRGIVIDETGHILDGDCIIAIIANHWLEKDKLPQKAVVGTVMSNYGLKVALERHGCKLICTSVGDKHVIEALIKHRLVLGGEQSGHIIFMEHLPAPDGLLTALQIIKIMKETGLPLSALAKTFSRYPQTLINIKVKEKKPFDEIPSLSAKVRECNSRLKDEGRILLRYSGTETLARVMVEGKQKDLVESIAGDLASIIKEDIGI